MCALDCKFEITSALIMPHIGYHKKSAKRYMNRLLSEEVFRTKGEFLWMVFRLKKRVTDRIYFI